MSLFILCIWKRLPNKYSIIDLIFFFEYFKAVAPSSSVLHCFRWEILILEMNCISLSVCSFYGFKYFEFGIYLRIGFFFFFSSCFFFLRFFKILGWWYYSFHQIWKNFSYYFFKYFSVTFFTLGNSCYTSLRLTEVVSQLMDKELCLLIFYLLPHLIHLVYFLFLLSSSLLFSIFHCLSLYLRFVLTCRTFLWLLWLLCHCCFCFKWWISPPYFGQHFLICMLTDFVIGCQKLYVLPCLILLILYSSTHS